VRLKVIYECGDVQCDIPAAGEAAVVDYEIGNATEVNSAVRPSLMMS